MSRTAIGWGVGGLLLACAMGAAMQQGGGTGRFQIVEVAHHACTIDRDGKVTTALDPIPVVLLLNTETGETRQMHIIMDAREGRESAGSWGSPLDFTPPSRPRK